MGGGDYASTTMPLYDVLNQMGNEATVQFFTFVAVVTLILYFVTSSDSASAVCDAMAAGGNPEPPLWQRVYWAFTEGIVAIVILTAGGDDADKSMNILKNVSIMSGLPFCMIMLGMCYSFYRGLEDYKYPERKAQLGEWRVGFVDAFTKYIAGIFCVPLCIGQGPIPCAAAWLTYCCPCFTQFYVHQQTITNFITKALYLVLVFTPWLMWFIFRAMSKHDDDANHATASIVYMVIVTIGAFNRLRIRSAEKIRGSFFADWLMFFFFPMIMIYQEYLNTAKAGPAEKQAVLDNGNKKGNTEMVNTDGAV